MKSKITYRQQTGFSSGISTGLYRYNHILRRLWMLMALLPFLFACQQKDQPKLIKIGLSHGKSHSFTQALELFARLLEEETGGRYQVKVFYGSQIGSEKEMQEMLTVGSLEMTVTGLLNTYEPLFSVFELPYLYQDRQHVLRVMESPVVEEVSQSLHLQGLRLFGFYENGYRHITNSKKPVNTPADLSGLMIRVPENPAQVQTFKALGAIPTPLSFSELYTALVQGVVDGQENPLQNIWFGRLYEAQQHIAMTGHIYNSAYVLMGNNLYESLSPADRAIFQACMKKSVLWQLDYMEETDKSLEGKLKEEGMAFTFPDQEIFREATLPAYEAIYKELGPRARDIVNDIRSLKSSTGVGRQILYINSYHQGYAPSDDILEGIQKELAGTGAELEIYYMDTKRNGSREHSKKVVGEVLQKIQMLHPEVIIASDDNAVKDLVVPHLVGGNIPVIFCGVNWSAEAYGLPSQNVGGMLEVLPLPELLDTLRYYYPKARTLTVLSENTLSEVKNKEILDTLFRQQGLMPDYMLVNNFEEWKRAYIKANEVSDLIYLPTNGAIKGWDDAEAVEFTKAHIKKPTVTCDDFMMKFSVLGFTKVAQEQGSWAAARALEVLDGKAVSGIPLAKNKAYNIWFNQELATALSSSPGQKLNVVGKMYSNQNNKENDN